MTEKYINKIFKALEKDKNSWPLFIKNLYIEDFRGWSEQEIQFNFPICAITGENGTGKTTILQACCLAYDIDYPSSAYPLLTGIFSRPKYDSNRKQNIADFTFIIKNGEQECLFYVLVSSGGKLPTEKGSKRDVVWIGLERIIDLMATQTLEPKIVTENLLQESRYVFLSDKYLKYYSYILGQPYDSVLISTDLKPSWIVCGVAHRKDYHMQHFDVSYGERSLLAILYRLETIQRNGLVLIDEIELALHPKAQRRLIRVITEIAFEKRLQVILSTYSEFVLDELPECARILIKSSFNEKKIEYGVSTNNALTTMDEKNHPECFFFVEDNITMVLLKEILREKIDLRLVFIQIIGSDTKFDMLNKIIGEKGFPLRSLIVRDPQYKKTNQQETETRIIDLPFNEMKPEKQIFNDILSDDDALNELSHIRNVQKNELIDSLKRSMTNLDEHDWPKDLSALIDGDKGEYLNLWKELCRIWVAIPRNKEKLDLFCDTLSLKIRS